MAIEQVTFDCVVNGMGVEVLMGVNKSLRDLVAAALGVARQGNAGHPSAADWEVRDEAGVLLDQAIPIKEFSFQPETRVWINLTAGFGA